MYVCNLTPWYTVAPVLLTQNDARLTAMMATPDTYNEKVGMSGDRGLARTLVHCWIYVFDPFFFPSPCLLLEVVGCEY